jgi:hypothetical protein
LPAEADLQNPETCLNQGCAQVGNEGRGADAPLAVKCNMICHDDLLLTYTKKGRRLFFNSSPASGFPVSSVLICIYDDATPKTGFMCYLNTASVDMSLSVQTDLFVLIHLYDPTILDYQGNCPETD